MTRHLRNKFRGHSRMEIRLVQPISLIRWLQLRSRRFADVGFKLNANPFAQIWAMSLVCVRDCTPNKIAAGNSHRACQFDGFMKFEHHHCSQAQSPVAVPELGR